MTRFCFLTSVLLLSAVPASAQISTVSTEVHKATYSCVVPEKDLAANPPTAPQPPPIAKLCSCKAPEKNGDKPVCTSPVATLTTHAKSGNWERLHNYGLEVVGTLAQDPGFGARLGDGREHYYRLIWKDSDLDGKPKVYQTVLHPRLRPEQIGRLPGITSTTRTKLVDILVANEKNTTLNSIYVSTPQPNPVLAQIPDVVSRIKLFETIAAGIGTHSAAHIGLSAEGRETDQKVVPPPTVTYRVHTPNLPLGRAEIQIKDIVTTPGLIDDLADAVTELTKSLEMREARSSACAKEVVQSHATALKDSSKESLCSTEGQFSQCVAGIKKSLQSSYEKAITSPVCKAEPAAGGSGDPVLVADTRFRELGQSLSEKLLSGDAKVTNVPESRFSFGLMTGVFVESPRSSTTRVKVDKGTIVEDPLSSALTAVVLNLHPASYDAARLTPSWSERFRFFTGITLTPDFGFTVGAGIGIVRGLAFNVGYAWLLPNKLKVGEQIDAKPVNANDPFEFGLARAAFASFSVTFK